MDTLTFIAEILKAVGWPIAIIALGIILRVPIANLLPLLNKLKYGNFEAEFSNNIRKMDEQAESIPIESGKRGTSKVQKAKTDTLRTRLLEIAKQSPAAAILESWRNIELELSRITAVRLPNEPRMPSWAQINKLHTAEAINSELKTLLDQLKVVRNDAAHPPGKLAIGESQTVTYIQSAAKAVDLLQRIK